MEKIHGVIQFWNEKKRFGIISSRNAVGSVDRFYLLYSRILTGKEPAENDRVCFVTKDAVVLQGKLPSAYEVEILTPETSVTPVATQATETRNAGVL